MEKTTFGTPWEIFMYDKMPFGIVNAGANFQHAMDIDFMGDTNKLIYTYLDDMNVFSKT